MGVAGSVLAALAQSLPLLVAARVLQGAGAAAGMVVGRAAVQDLFHGPQRTRVMAYVGMTLGLCPPTGTVVGGQIHEALGWQANFVLSAGLGVVLLAAAWWGLPRQAPQASGTDPARSARDTRVVLSVLAGMGHAYAQLLRMPLYLLHVAILGLTTLAGLIGPGILLALTFLIGSGFMLATPAQQASVNELVSREELPRAVALGAVSFNMARAVGPALAGAIAAWLGSGSAFLAAAESPQPVAAA